MISIIAILIALLLPSLGSAREASRLNVCLMQNRDIGAMLTMWGGDHKEVLPESNEKLSRGRGIDSTFIPNSDTPTGLAKLIRAGYHRDPRTLYCPEWKHPSAQYDNVGTDPGPWNLNPYGGWPADDNAATLSVVMISYHYRAAFWDPQANRNQAPADLGDPEFNSDTPLNADHWTRREGLFGFLYGHGEKYNTLYADMHAATVIIKECEFDTYLGLGLSNGSWVLQHNAWDALFVD